MAGAMLIVDAMDGACALYYTRIPALTMRPVGLFSAFREGSFTFWCILEGVSRLSDSGAPGADGLSGREVYGDEQGEPCYEEQFH